MMYVSPSALEKLFLISAWKADRTESYTRITPFQEKHDTTVE